MILTKEVTVYYQNRIKWAFKVPTMQYFLWALE